MIGLENEKVRLLVMARQLEQEEQKLFEKICLERGLTPNSHVEINAETGALTPVAPANL